MKRLHKSTLTLLAILILSLTYTLLETSESPTVSPSPTPIKTAVINPSSVLVTEVIDGDTIVFENGQHIRFIGIDSPELHHPKKPVGCFGQEAKDKLTKLILGRKVRLEKDVSETDRYKRLLRYVYVDPSTSSRQAFFINDYMVRQGYAVAVTFPPDVKYKDELRAAQNEAEQENRGLWNSCNLSPTP